MMNGTQALSERKRRPKTIALFVIGGSPAILTETLAAYVGEGGASVPQAIRIITTKEGARRLSDRFLVDHGWADFIDEYPEYADVRFDETVIQVAGDLDDIRDEDDSKVMMAAVCRMVQESIADGNMRMFASIAGGRKTMTYYLGFAMSLFAQPGDRITHVLVPAEWEYNRDFLFPPRSEVSRVTLIDTPFIRLRGFLSQDINKATVGELINATQNAIDTAAMQPLTLNFDRCEVEFLGKRHRLSPREFTFYYFFIQQKRRYCSQPEQTTCGICTACYLDYEQMSDERRVEDLKMIRQASGVSSRKANDPTVKEFAATWSSFENFRNGFPEVKNRINNKLKKAFGLLDTRVNGILLVKKTTSGYTKFGLAVDKSQIRIERD